MDDDSDYDSLIEELNAYIYELEAKIRVLEENNSPPIEV